VAPGNTGSDFAFVFSTPRLHIEIRRGPSAASLSSAPLGFRRGAHGHQILNDFCRCEQRVLFSSALAQPSVPARSLVCNAIKAAVEAIEASNYSVMLPMQFALRSMPDDGLPAINPDAIEIERGMRVRFVDGR
jgi:hypothetical protein